MRYLFITVLIVILIISCNKNGNIKDPRLENIENHISSKPDSILQILNSIDISPKDEFNTNLYSLYVIKCKSKANKDLSKDTDIINVFNYFDANNDQINAAEASYLCGLVMKDTKEYGKAINYFNVAESLTIANSNKKLQGLILYSKSELLLDQLLIEQAKDQLQKAIKLFKLTGDSQYEIKGYSNVALSFLINQQYDSSSYYYDKAYEIASLHHNNVERAYAVKDKGLIYLDIGDYLTSVKLVNEAKNIDSTIIQSGKADLIISNAYLGLNKIDSARLYLDKSLNWIEKNEDDNIEMLRTIYLYASMIEESAENYAEALKYSKLYTKYLAQYTEDNKNDAIIDAERKYKYEVAQNQIAELSLNHIKKERLILVLLLMIALSTVIYYYFILKKNRLLLLKKEQLNKANNDILNLTDSLTSYKLKKNVIIKDYENRVKSYYVDSYEILKRAASLEYFVQDAGDKASKILIKKFNEIAYGQTKVDWHKLYSIINTIYDNLFDKIKEQFSELDETEYRICCLTIAKMTSNEMAAIMQLSVHTIHMKTTNIRKKLGVEKYGSVAAFFEKNIK